MIIADTSVWIQHLRSNVEHLQRMLLQRRIAMHPFILGELVCGNLPDRSRFIHMLKHLPQAPVADHDAVLGLVESRKLMGRGIGWVDAHLLSSALQGRHRLWTVDANLSDIADELNVRVMA